MKCQEIMNPNMKSPQRKAITIQISSTLSIGSFHQMRCGGGVAAIAMFPLENWTPPNLRRARSSLDRSSLGQRNGSHFHHAPDQVENGRNGDAEKQQQEGIIEDPLHRWHTFLARLRWIHFIRRHDNTPE